MAWQVNQWSTRRKSAQVLALIAFATMQQARAADDQQVITPYAQYSILYDDNLLRLRDAAAAQSAVGTTQMSDYVHSTVGGIRFDRMFSRQHIKLDASLNKNSFDYFKQFDNDGRDLNAYWGWALGEHLTGDIGYVYSQALTPFQNLRVLEKNIRTMQTKYATIAWQLHPDWTVRAQYSRFGLDYDLQSQQANNFTQDIADLGLDYTARSGSIAGVVVRHTKANYPESTVLNNGSSINNSFTQDELKARVTWLYSAKTKLQFLGGYVTRERVNGGSADYSGFNARLIADWQATAKTAFKMNLWREIGGLSDVDANYALTTGISLAATLKASDKLRFDGSLDYQRRNYNGAAVITGVTPSSRKDRYQKASFGITYYPTRSLSLMMGIYREDVQSNIDSFGYVSNGIALTTRYEF
ncbi:outer membrane beta-barrel protein [Herbaspirillum sp. LeCh32-8]|uniref:XrtB/PEP-CTERM-associated polysaccharide biosynthesis outer membrane protein EpsL n=1 Tax=Herbaspirillum sp. LeCh32-8 TaxID=2821356 RepID=UPI001AE21BC5|nr:XrtB/PEP-CTERM-associated polysaccharide biosynthesis outer membrane protein EpsL [Herbaspirillum sp. LeCh32-8]MBP0596902.1 outer membrane beta-barrel protein [Herbaspirillum sp. LeCh32-8]